MQKAKRFLQIVKAEKQSRLGFHRPIAAKDLQKLFGSDVQSFMHVRSDNFILLVLSGQGIKKLAGPVLDTLG